MNICFSESRGELNREILLGLMKISKKNISYERETSVKASKTENPLENNDKIDQVLKYVLYALDRKNQLGSGKNDYEYVNQTDIMLKKWRRVFPIAKKGEWKGGKEDLRNIDKSSSQNNTSNLLYRI